MTNLILLAFWMVGPGARAPETPAEWRLIGILVFVGLALSACLLAPLLRNLRLLDSQKKDRGERGRSLVARMASPTRFPTGTTMGLSLRGQDLRGEDLKDAFLADVDLSDTDLRGVDLTGANLGGAFLVGALYDARTRWPAGFDPVKHGARLVE